MQLNKKNINSPSLYGVPSQKSRTDIVPLNKKNKCIYFYLRELRFWGVNNGLFFLSINWSQLLHKRVSVTQVDIQWGE